MPRSKGATGLQQYHAFGLRIASELTLPELHPGHGPADVRIRFARMPAGRSEPLEPWVEMVADAMVLRFEGIRFAVRQGTEIDIEAPAETAERDVRIWLLGTVAAALLQQRGYLPVHANVVKRPDGSAAAFAGASGAGKSTLAAWMEAAGHEVLTDDLCAILPSGDGAPQVFEGIPRMKLRPDSLGAFGRSADGLEKVAWDLDKYHVPMQRAPREGSLEPLPLDRIYLLGRAQPGEPFSINRMSGMDAALGVLGNAYRWYLGQLIHGEERAQFDQCLGIARRIPVFEVFRTWDLARLDEQARAIERHMSAPVGEVDA